MFAEAAKERVFGQKSLAIWATDFCRLKFCGVGGILNPDARSVHDMPKHLLSQGDAIKTISGERIPARRVVWYDAQSEFSITTGTPSCTTGGVWPSRRLTRGSARGAPVRTTGRWLQEPVHWAVIANPHSTAMAQTCVQVPSTTTVWAWIWT